MTAFGEHGFAKKHKKRDVTRNNDPGLRMRDANGHGVSIAQMNQMPRDMVSSCVSR